MYFGSFRLQIRGYRNGELQIVLGGNAEGLRTVHKISNRFQFGALRYTERVGTVEVVCCGCVGERCQLCVVIKARCDVENNGTLGR